MLRRLTTLLALSALLAAGPVAAQTTDEVLTPKTFIKVSKQVLPSVVSISVRNQQVTQLLQSQDPQMEEFLRFFGRTPGQSLEDINSSAGSGFIIRVDGSTAYVLTNNHVVQRTESDADIALQLDASSWTTDTDTGPRIGYGNVRVVGRDSLADLAVLAFDIPEGVTARPLDFADSDMAEVGEWVLVLGNPLEFNNSVSEGIISARGRYLGSSITIQNLLQTTASINPGNSGGPMVNLEGRVVGVSNAIASRNGLWQGVGFAIPSNDARRISTELLDHGRVRRGYLGVQMMALAMEPDLARRYGIEDFAGVLVESVQADTPALAAGLEPADLIRAVDSRPVKDPDDMLRAIAARGAGDTIKLDVLRLDEDGEPVQIIIETSLMERPSEQDLASAQRNSDGLPGLLLPERDDEFFGLAVRESRTSGGVVVESVAPGSPAARAGIREGDVLRRISGVRVRGVEDFREAMKSATPQKPPVVSYERDGSSMFATITP
ncbi:MAG: trypsin-like peptidase domain-containing protein [Candidatus Sumerlaeia bacterium]|nr:trypsin-like peptidase domain-containing protein [Candidatus Sumerlaeia bacterium]